MTTNDESTSTPVDVSGLKTAPRDFSAMLLDLRKGRTHDELSHAVRDVVAACIATGKPGEINLKLKFTPATDADDQVRCNDEVNTKVPAPDRKSTSFYVSDDNDLVRDNPNAVPFPGMPSPR